MYWDEETIRQFGNETMRQLDNLEMRQLGSGRSGAGEVGELTDSADMHKIFLHSEQIELAQFGRVLHDWRPKEKQKKIKQQDNK